MAAYWETTATEIETTMERMMPLEWQAAGKMQGRNSSGDGKDGSAHFFRQQMQSNNKGNRNS